ncbi:uncharacterized protein PHACADRAFT_204643 [Phanerochaete carnosa HHB-10118-sp]|uniref:Cleavage stimulation factor subunit 2 hinge domain-containing protein n=1 Tax=Phanerochaete carnosa (strain HHB-10118-sp) TaxID=650164 RepID=K5XEI0_PHACS|nr:uncharacterized protein PHACADRAFT_204643 [Phanerochaete carnosa HHB-10118-sp]EKM61472.1 hypothetical protein PHACADRAFT_204643 [Phanerochaete carnosa HHB-10118-sp]
MRPEEIMASPAAQEEQLLELLLQLKKTTPDQARAILNAQPQIAYALMALMVNLNAINMEVTQKTLAAFGAGSAPAATPGPVSVPTPGPAYAPSVPPPAPHIPVQPIPAIPPYLNNQHNSGGNTPPYARGGTPTYPQSNIPLAYPSRGGTPNYPPPGPSYPVHQQQHPGPGYPPQNMPPHMRAPYGGPPPPQIGGYGGPPPHNAPPPQAASALPEALQNIPEDQKALIMRVIQMTPDQIAQLPPHEQTTMIQLRQTLGLPA